MSKRRNGGEIVWKVPGAGFLGLGETVILVAEKDHRPCILDCGDPDCREWSDAYVVGDHNAVVYHISECEMEDHAPDD